MKKLLIAGIAMLAVAISSCDEDTNNLGNSLTNPLDKFTITTDTFDVSTRSIIVDSVLARSSCSYIGRLKDPETGSYISSDFTTQFSLLEGNVPELFVVSDDVVSRDAEGLPIADSCKIAIVINSYMGDSLTAMKLRTTELSKPLKENMLYYSNFDPKKEGYLRNDGIIKNTLWSVSDLTSSDSIRALRRKGAYYENITISLNDPYTDKSGKTYNNFGTYIMRQYFDHPEYFKNSQAFIHNVCPGFYFETTDGQGVLCEVERTQLMIYYRYQNGEVVSGKTVTIDGTEEVLQTTHYTSDRASIERLAANNECTYLKAPDGIYTEVTLPIDEIKRYHENDSIASARIVFRRMNEISELSDYILQEPENLLMLERDSLFSFFEERKLPNNITSYLATYSSARNSYTFNNISELVNHMYSNRNKTENWNKVVLVPVNVTMSAASTTSSTATKTVTGVSNELRVTSVRMVGGSENKHAPVRISIVYNKNQ